ncbi:MAG: hypothetical protein M1831_003275 [Alyxoria varia]|nr:MAG: hypothetical protein M1831_003275 [Alyxoria varia]
MNRYSGPPSKASASTLCQKCLKRGHYSFECKVSVQQRPYASRPSRTKQLKNPNLQPKLSDDTPNPLLRKEGIADEQLAKAAEERARKRKRSESVDSMNSASSSDSVSTISTNKSKSPSPSPARKTLPPEKERDRNGGKSKHRSRSVSFSSYSPDDRSRRRERDRSTRTKREYSSPHGRRGRERRNSRSKSPERRGQDGSMDRSRITRNRRPSSPSRPDGFRDRPHNRSGPDRGHGDQRHRKPDHRMEDAPRARSLSPYSKRIALTQAMNI